METTLGRLQRQYKEWSGSDAFIPKIEGQNLLDVSFHMILNPQIIPMLFKYVIGFRWSEEKFASTETLTDIVHTIMEQVHSFDEELKRRTTDYSQRKQVSRS